MAKSFFNDDSSNSPGDKVFATEYLAANKKELGKHFTVQEIVLAKSGKGYMLHTEHFVCWLWKNSKLTKMLIEALRAYVENGNGYYLFVELTTSNKDCFQIGMDDSITSKWYDLGNESYSLTPRDVSSMESGNPFIPPVLSLPIENEKTEDPLPPLPQRSRKQA